MGDEPDTYCLGSQFWSKKSSYKPGYAARFGILLDMVGAKDAQFSMEEVSVSLAKNVVDKGMGCRLTRSASAGISFTITKAVLPMITYM